MTTKPKKFCFVLMPFNTEFDDIYKLGIKQSCIDAGAYSERVDEQIYTESMLERIYNQISKADIVIADMTGRNPNVFYEVGYAHALGKKTILLTQNTDDIPFDLKHYPHIVYEKKIVKLKEDLTKKVQWLLENIDKEIVSIQNDFELYFNSENLSKSKVSYSLINIDRLFITFSLYNNSMRTYYSDDYKVGIITEREEHLIYDASYSRVILPDGREIHMLPHFGEILYPYGYTSFQMHLSETIFPIGRFGEIIKEFKKPGIKQIILRMFTSSGTRDFEFYLELNNNILKR